MEYGVATTSRLLKIIGLFCERALSKRRYSAKETYHFKTPTHRSHPIANLNQIGCVCVSVFMFFGVVFTGLFSGCIGLFYRSHLVDYFCLYGRVDSNQIGCECVSAFMFLCLFFWVSFRLSGLVLGFFAYNHAHTQTHTHTHTQTDTSTRIHTHAHKQHA